MSKFSLKWRTSMVARRKLVALEDPESARLSISRYASAARKAIEKDMHLIEAALAADRIIVTRDQLLLAALATRPDGAACSRRIRWINPVTDGIEALKAL